MIRVHRILFGLHGLSPAASPLNPNQIPFRCHNPLNPLNPWLKEHAKLELHI